MTQVADRSLDIARSILAGAGRCEEPVASAEVLPAAAYADEDFFAFEERAVFARDWLYAGHVNQVPEAGDRSTRQVLGRTVSLTRGADGAVAVRDEDGTVARHEVFHGFVFMNHSADAAPLGPTLAKLDRELATYRTDELVPTPSYVRRDLPFNWKGYFENSLEPYHTDFVHAGTHQAAPARLSGFFDFDPGDGQILTYTGFAEGESNLLAEAVGDRTAGHLPPITGLSDVARSRILFAAVPPTFFAVITPVSVLVEAVDPVSAATTDIESTILYPAASLEQADFEALHADELTGLRLIQHQDEVTQGAVQRTLGSRFVPRGTLSWLEATLPQFYRWSLERYRAELARAGG